MSKFRKANIKATIGNSIIDNKIINLKSIDKSEFGSGISEIQFYSADSLNSINIEEEDFTNFICDDKMFPDDIYDVIDELVSVSTRYLVKMKNSALRCVNAEKTEEIKPFKDGSYRDERFKRLLAKVNPELIEAYYQGALFKYRPKEVNSTSNIGIRLYGVFHSDDNLEKYYRSIFLIDLYHLAIPSRYNEFSHREYQEKFYKAIKHADKNLKDFFEV